MHIYLFSNICGKGWIPRVGDEDFRDCKETSIIADVSQWSGEVKIFPIQNLWVHVSASKKYTEMFRDLSARGLTLIAVTLGKKQVEHIPHA